MRQPTRFKAHLDLFLQFLHEARRPLAGYALLGTGGVATLALAGFLLGLQFLGLLATLIGLAVVAVLASVGLIFLVHAITGWTEDLNYDLGRTWHSYRSRVSLELPPR